MSAWIVIGISLLLSAFFSGMEIAYLASNKLRIEIDNENHGLAQKLMKFFLAKPGMYITTILVGNNVVMVIYGAKMSKILNDSLSALGLSVGLEAFLATVISTVVILFVAEFLPKAIFRLRPNSFFRIFVIPVYFFYILFYPVSLLSVRIGSLLMKLTGKELKNAEVANSFGKVDLNNLLDEGGADDLSSEDEHEIKLFKNALDFPEVKIRECMIPRTDLVALSEDADIDELISLFVSSGHSRILIYRDTVDNIIGYVHSSAMFRSPSSISEVVTAPILATETMTASHLMDVLIKAHKSLAVVVDEFGVTAGIVAMEDIMEEIFGEIEDEHDHSDNIEKKMSDGTYLFSGKLEVDYLNEKYQLNLVENDAYETLAGYILFYNESIPETGEVLNINGKSYRIIKRNGARIEEVQLL